MKLTARQREGVSIIEPNGKITIVKGDVALRDAVQEALNAGSINILIKLMSIASLLGAKKLKEQYESTSSTRLAKALVTLGLSDESGVQSGAALRRG